MHKHLASLSINAIEVRKMNMQTLTQEYLKSVLNYDPETGLFVRIKRTSNSVKIGDVAGSIKMSSGGKRYIAIRVNGKKHSAHRLAFLYMTGNFPENQVDHDDGNGTNNKWLNLNDVSNIENSRNQRLSAANTSDHTGVRWNKKERKWKVRIGVNYEMITLGTFDDFFEAICRRKSAENKYGFHPNHGTIRPL